MIQDVEDLVTEIDVMAEKVCVVVLHLGSCNWQGDIEAHIDTGEAVYLEYVESLNTISSMYPHAELVASSVLPRSTTGFEGASLTHQENINNQVTILNRRLRELAEVDSNVTYNDNGILYEGVPNSDLYVEHDKTGVYLNENELMILTHNMTHDLRRAWQENVQNENWVTM
jgi:hypothetical protein